MWNEKEKEFLLGLEQLTRKTGIVIGGCGCCSSPFLEELDEEPEEEDGYGEGYAKEVHWISKADEYDWNEFSQNIVK